MPPSLSMSRPTVSKAQTSYPIYAASFANSRPGYLVVGGGGGAGRHGVKNSITLFDFNSRAPTVQPCAEAEVSKDDSVTCLANLATKDGLIVYAGIGGSEEDRLKDRNMHFQAFEVRFPAIKATIEGGDKLDGNISFLSKTTLFTPPQSTNAKKENYQRVVRLSPPQRTASSTPTKRIGAIASSLAGDENEIVVFGATSNRPDAQDIIQRIGLYKGQEANDVDILDQGEGRFQVAYALDQEVYLQDINYDFDQRRSKEKSERRKLYTVPHADVMEKKPRSKLRCIRWLSPKHLLLLANKPNRTGVDLLVLHMYEEGPASVVLRKTLPKHVKAATDMDVALLDPGADGVYQIVVAVAAIDNSLSVYVIDYHGPARDSLSNLHLFDTYTDVHSMQMTKVVFSPFYKSDAPVGKTAAPQYLRLASTSLGNTISVETFELQYYGSRHVLQTARTRTMYQAAYYIVAAVVIAAVSLMIQSLIDPEGSLTRSLLPASLQSAASQHKPFGELLREKRHQAILNNADSPVVKTAHRISDLLHLHFPDVSHDAVERQKKALVIAHDPDAESSLSTEVHEGDEDVVKKHAAARKWDELSKEEKKRWREKLVDAGMWTVGEGETVLKSIFFSEMGGLVGAAARGVLG
ncbi:hypothetical protein P153DRAFT_332039 [Dothidotthia symphoricarpi CBS 119687]|uniref:Guanine nucleotide-exchange factor SEC12 n=1 Tax=Dothidotthia symphoricarpi CBS 119687 TaxID=1392245 RepID=A0A6A6AR88_9PLEO|nr:uncharacterized protein P153DRAFT_332039 [Dothidotthia symphoricarpi CBS 119687]KAF2133357.1 hypothetical protein P153DRAFT_332039 [Dothidotthia symphoricarpi CBS 119687]